MFRGLYPIARDHDQLSNQSSEDFIRDYFISRRIPGYEEVSEKQIPPPEESINAVKVTTKNKHKNKSINNENDSRNSKSIANFSDTLKKELKNESNTRSKVKDNSERKKYIQNSIDNDSNNNSAVFSESDPEPVVCNSRERKWKFEEGKYVGKKTEARNMVAWGVRRSLGKHAPFYKHPSTDHTEENTIFSHPSCHPDYQLNPSTTLTSPSFCTQKLQPSSSNASLSKRDNKLNAPSKDIDSREVQLRSIDKHSSKSNAIQIESAQRVSFADDEAQFALKDSEAGTSEGALKVIERRNERRKMMLEEERIEKGGEGGDVGKDRKRESRVDASFGTCSLLHTSSNSDMPSPLPHHSQPQKPSINTHERQQQKQQQTPCTHVHETSPNASKSLQTCIQPAFTTLLASATSHSIHSSSSKLPSETFSQAPPKNSNKTFNKESQISQKRITVSKNSHATSTTTPVPNSPALSCTSLDTTNISINTIFQAIATSVPSSPTTTKATKATKATRATRATTNKLSSTSSIEHSFTDYELDDSLLSNHVTPEQAQEALLKSLSSNCCYGLSAARNMEIFDILPYIAYHYTLETFSESRTLAFCHEPYRGLKEDERSESRQQLPLHQPQQHYPPQNPTQQPSLQQSTPETCIEPRKSSQQPLQQRHHLLENSPSSSNSSSKTSRSGKHHHHHHQKQQQQPQQPIPPLPWEIDCAPKKEFVNEVLMVEVPHTSSVTCCFVCTSSGWYRCDCCSGEGIKRCLNCCGSGHRAASDVYGHRQTGTCWHCHGTGRRRCSVCYGDGKVVCSTCQGFRSLKCCIKLKVEYFTHVTDKVLERYELPEELVLAACGRDVIHETLNRVHPITNYEELIFNTSRNVLHEHILKCRNTRVLRQRQKLRAISVAESSYLWDGLDGKFWVFGTEMDVYAPDYPQKMCWGCLLS